MILAVFALSIWVPAIRWAIVPMLLGFFQGNRDFKRRAQITLVYTIETGQIEKQELLGEVEILLQ